MGNDLTKLSSPRIFLIRMLVFLILCGLIAFVLQKQIANAFFANRAGSGHFSPRRSNGSISPIDASCNGAERGSILP